MSTIQLFYKNILGAKCKSTWDGATAGYECERPEKMFILQTGDGHGQKLHRFGLEEANGKADRIELIALIVQIKPFLNDS